MPRVAPSVSRTMLYLAHPFRARQYARRFALQSARRAWLNCDGRLPIVRREHALAAMMIDALKRVFVDNKASFIIGLVGNVSERVAEHSGWHSAIFLSCRSILGLGIDVPVDEATRATLELAGHSFPDRPGVIALLDPAISLQQRAQAACSSDVYGHSCAYRAAVTENIRNSENTPDVGLSLTLA